MAHVCPWWFVRAFDNPLRRLVHPPQRVFADYVTEGMAVVDVGCGAGFHTEGLARLVGPHGRVVAVDLQPRMLAMTARRLKRIGLFDRVEIVQATASDLRIPPGKRFSFVNVFWMVHEVSDVRRLFAQIRDVMRPGAMLLLCEPRFHVSQSAFDRAVDMALSAGFEVRARPTIAFSRSVLFVISDGS